VQPLINLLSNLSGHGGIVGVVSRPRESRSLMAMFTNRVRETRSIHPRPANAQSCHALTMLKSSAVRRSRIRSAYLRTRSPVFIVRVVEHLRQIEG